MISFLSGLSTSISVKMTHCYRIAWWRPKEVAFTQPGYSKQPRDCKKEAIVFKFCNSIAELTVLVVQFSYNLMAKKLQAFLRWTCLILYILDIQLWKSISDVLYKNSPAMRAPIRHIHYYKSCLSLSPSGPTTSSHIQPSFTTHAYINSGVFLYNTNLTNPGSEEPHSAFRPS